MQSVNILVVVRDSASGQLRSIGASADRTGSKFKSMGRLAKLGMLAVAAGGVIAAKSLFDATQEASDLSETISKAGQIFGGSATKQLVKWAEAAATTMGQSQQTALDAAATFGVFGKSAGLAGGELVRFAKQNTQLATDMASFNNTSPEEAIVAIGAAFRGEMEPIRQYGVLLDDASLRQQALKMHLVQTTADALSPQNKVLAAQALILKQTTDQQGDFARTSGGLANQQRILSAEWANMRVELGQKLLPVALRLTHWMIEDGLPGVQKLGDWLGSKLGPAVGDVVRWFQKGSSSGGDLSGVMDDMGSFVGDARSAWQTLNPLLSRAAKDLFPVMVNQIKTTAQALRILGNAAIVMWNIQAPVWKLMLNALGLVTQQMGATLKAISKVPGMGWVGKLADGLLHAGGEARALAANIRQIPTQKDVRINVTTVRTTVNGSPGRSDIPLPGQPDGRVAATHKRGGGVGWLSAGAITLLEGLVPGINKTKKAGAKVLDLVRADLDDKKQKLQDIMDASSDFAESFKGWAKSIFSMQSSDEAPLTLSSLMQGQHNEEAKSMQVLSDVQQVLRLGLSKDLTEQLQASGEQGAETLHLLAQADSATIAEFNRSNAQTMKNYGDAGIKAADKVYGAAMAQAQASRDVAQSLVDVIAGVKNLEKVEFIVRGNDLVAVLKKKDKDNGK